MRHPMLSVCMSVAAFASSLASAAPKDELHAAFVKFLAARSFHTEVANAKTGEALSSMDFVAPDRYRVHPAKGPMQVIVGDTIYMDLSGMHHADAGAGYGEDGRAIPQRGFREGDRERHERAGAA